MKNSDEHKTDNMVKRINATLPDSLGVFVGAMTGDDGLYETPSEFIRDLIRKEMEKSKKQEVDFINQCLLQSIAENSYSDWTDHDLSEVRKIIDE